MKQPKLIPHSELLFIRMETVKANLYGIQLQCAETELHNLIRCWLKGDSTRNQEGWDHLVDKLYDIWRGSKKTYLNIGKSKIDLDDSKDFNYWMEYAEKFLCHDVYHLGLVDKPVDEYEEVEEGDSEEERIEMIKGRELTQEEFEIEEESEGDIALIAHLNTMYQHIELGKYHYNRASTGKKYMDK